MSAAPDLAGLPDLDVEQVAGTLRTAGARFAFMHGSRISATNRPDSDLDIAAWFGRTDVRTWTIEVPDEVDLIGLDDLPLDVAGRIAVDGLLLFDDDPSARVRWQADTRLRYFDESWRREAATRDFLEGVAARG